MTDNEIIKALECCSIKHACSECPYARNKGCSCINGILKDTLDLINRLQAENDQLTEKFNCQQTVYADLSKIIKDQKAEIERLKKENEILSINADTAFQDGLNEAQDLYAEQVKTEIKSEAIKEFAERLKKDFFNTEYHIDRYYRKSIDNLVKEMVGEDL